MKFSVLFWNVWLENQLEGPAHSKKLLKELEIIINKFHPDCIGLNELLQDVDSSSPFVLDFLKTLGYEYNYFVASSPFTDEWLIGAGICSKYKLVRSEPIVLGDDGPATRRGYLNHTVKSAATKVELAPGKIVGFIAAHPIAIKWYTSKDHYKHIHRLTEFLQTDAYNHDTIIGGDFNEPAHIIPGSFKQINRHTLNYRSGTFKNPTWRHKASEKALLRFNLDKLFWTKKGSLKLEHFEVVDSNISDHRPLFARFDFK